MNTEVFTKGIVERRKTIINPLGVEISSVRAPEYNVNETLVFLDRVPETPAELAINEITGSFDDHDSIVDLVHQKLGVW